MYAAIVRSWTDLVAGSTPQRGMSRILAAKAEHVTRIGCQGLVLRL
jgi:hypothetical protein